MRNKETQEVMPRAGNHTFVIDAVYTEIERGDESRITDEYILLVEDLFEGVEFDSDAEKTDLEQLAYDIIRQHPKVESVRGSKTKGKYFILFKS